MAWTFNPFSGTFDQKGSGGGGGGSSYLEGEVQNFSALPTSTPPAVDAAYLVREAEGTWLLNRKPAGIYIRVATTGTRATDWTYAGEFPDVFNDANLVIYNDTDSTKNVKFDVSAVTTGTTRTISAPDKNITLDDAGDSRTPSSHTHGNLTNDGKIGSTSGLPLKTGTSGVVEAGAFGTGAGEFCAGDDARLSDDRNPLSHAASHAAAGSDPVFDQDLNTTDDVEFNSVGFGVDFTVDTFGLNWAGQLIFEPETNTFNDNSGNFAFSVGSIVEFGKKIRLQKTGDASAVVELDADSVSALTTRAIAFPDASGTLALQGAITTSGLTQATARILGRTTASTGAVEELTVSGGASLSAGELAVHAQSHAITSTSDHTAGNWKVFHSNGSGEVVELALGDSGKVLQSNGASAAPTWETPSGGVSGVAASAGDVLDVSGSNITGVDAGADRLVFWDDSAGELTYLEAGSGLSISGTTLTATASGGSKTYAVFTAEHNQPPASNYATLDTRNSVACLDFDDATDESAVFVGIIPEGASLGSGLKIRLHWAATAPTTSGDVRWDVQLERMTTDLDSDSFDTVASSTATTSGTSGILTVTEITLTTIDSVTAGDGFRLKVTRDANNAADTMSGDCELYICEVRSAA